MDSLPVPPPVLALAAGAAQRLLSRGHSSSGLSRLSAALLGGASVALATSAAASFRKQGTTIDPIHLGRTSTLVTDGPHAVSRNPMYVGMVGVLLAHAAARKSVAALLPVAAFVAVMDRLQIAAEEASLREQFGVRYDTYAQQVPRWLGLDSLNR